MKLNINKIGTSYGIVIDGEKYTFGWYESGKAFVAKDNELLTYSEAYSKFVPKGVYILYNAFYIGLRSYGRNMSGIVHYLIDKCCRNE